MATSQFWYSHPVFSGLYSSRKEWNSNMSVYEWTLRRNQYWREDLKRIRDALGIEASIKYNPSHSQLKQISCQALCELIAVTLWWVIICILKGRFDLKWWQKLRKFVKLRSFFFFCHDWTGYKGPFSIRLIYLTLPNLLILIPSTLVRSNK